ncbi:MAG TPA: hypothetical protein PKW32_18760, partial [Verrucomicrobiota bacterium]|nr:hypothetical protein [Verrucomicrobiota bacterium]
LLLAHRPRGYARSLRLASPPNPLQQNRNSFLHRPLVAALYGFCLIWGQARLPFAAIKGLADYRLLEAEPSVSAPIDALHMWKIQE